MIDIVFHNFSRLNTELKNIEESCSNTTHQRYKQQAVNEFSYEGIRTRTL